MGLTSYDSTANFCIKAFTDPQAGPPSTSLSITSPTGAQTSGQTYTLAGHLRDSSGAGVPWRWGEIYVWSSDYSSWYWKTVTTDANGYWSTTIATRPARGTRRGSGVTAATGHPRRRSRCRSPRRRFYHNLADAKSSDAPVSFSPLPTRPPCRPHPDPRHHLHPCRLPL
ncbi:MAG: hypothetical protein ACXV3E_05510 [Halobacteriota archaeon]